MQDSHTHTELLTVDEVFEKYGYALTEEQKYILILKYKLNKVKNKKENLYGWLLTYNPYTDKWLAAKRDDYLDLFSNVEKNENILRSNSIDTLIEVIMKTNGDKKAIDKLLKN